MKDAILLIVTAMLMTGCIAYHRPNTTAEQNWVKQPPKNIEEERAHIPPRTKSDTFYFAPGMFTSMGVYRPDRGDRRFNANLGLEWTVGYAQTFYRASGYLNKRNDFPRIKRAFALKAGWAAVENRGEFNGPFYLEALFGAALHPAMIFGLGAGWATDLEDNHHGFLVSGYLGPLYMRVQHLVDDRTEVLWGLRFDIPVMFIFDR